MLTRRTTRLYRTLCFATVALLLLLPLLAARDAEASGSVEIQGNPELVYKDAMLASGPVVYIGPPESWDSMEDDGLHLAWLQYMVDLYGGVDAVAEPGDPFYNSGTEIAAAHLRAVGIELGATATLEVHLEPLSNWSTYVGNGGSEIVVEPAESMTVTFGGLRFGDFDARWMESVTFANDSRFPDHDYNSFYDVCSETYFFCSWLRGFGFVPETKWPTSSPLEMDGSGSGYERRGMRLIAVNGNSSAPLVVGDEETVISLDPPGFLMVDLIVPDLPSAYTDCCGNSIRVVAYVESGSFYVYAPPVPAMSLRGGAVLVIVVLAAGILALALPRRRAA